MGFFLRARAYAADNEREIVRSGGLPRLVDLLRSPEHGVQQCAAGALYCLAANGEVPAPLLARYGEPSFSLRAAENQILIAEAGGIVPLIELLQSPSSAVQVGGGGCRAVHPGGLSEFCFAVSSSAGTHKSGCEWCVVLLAPPPPFSEFHAVCAAR